MSAEQMEKDLARKLRERLRALRDSGRAMPHAVVGLDGFVDEIVHVVDKREDVENFERIRTIPEFAHRAETAAGRSANIELVTKRTKIGGNGPIMANALLDYGARVTYIGALGRPNLNPVFKPLYDRCTAFSLAEAAHTDALEFHDGKLLMGKMESMRQVTWKRMVSVVGFDRLVELAESCRGMALNNWTMVPYMTEIFEHFTAEICPKLSRDRRRVAFFDLADPEKRTAEDVRRMLDLLKKFSGPFDVVLGLNEREAREIAGVLGMHQRAREDKFVNELCRFIADDLGIFCVLVHPIKYAVACTSDGEFHQDGPTTTSPAITTGAGDHLNAAFFLGLMLGMDIRTCLLMGVCSSGYYVINGRTPTPDQLMAFMETWRAGQDERNR